MNQNPERQPLSDTTPEHRSGFDRRSVDKFLGVQYRLSPPASLTLRDLEMIRTALQTRENVEHATALLDVAIALGTAKGVI